MNLLSLKNELMKHTGYFLEKSVKIVSKEICYSDEQYFCNNNFSVGRDFGIRCHVKGLNKKIELVLIPLPSFLLGLSFRVSFGIFIQHFNVPGLNLYICLILLSSQNLNCYPLIANLPTTRSHLILYKL